MPAAWPSCDAAICESARCSPKVETVCLWEAPVGKCKVAPWRRVRSSLDTHAMRHGAMPDARDAGCGAGDHSQFGRGATHNSVSTHHTPATRGRASDHQCYLGAGPPRSRPTEVRATGTAHTSYNSSQAHSDSHISHNITR